LKNIAKNSKFTKAFSYPKFVQPPVGKNAAKDRKSVATRRQQAELRHAEKRAAAEKSFENCTELLKQLKEKEILVASGQAEDNTQMIQEQRAARENIRANRLHRYEEMARKDEEFQQATSEALKLLMESIVVNQDTMALFVNLFERIVDRKTSNQ